jgi:hypothetical protein
LEFIILTAVKTEILVGESEQESLFLVAMGGMPDLTRVIMSFWIHEDIQIVPWRNFLSILWGGEIIA